jgi:adenylyltransferase/sulfurtransferase
LDGSRAIESEAASVLCGRDAVQIQTSSRSIDLARLAQRWQRIGTVQQTPFFVRLRPDDIHSLTVFRDGRAVITGTDQISEARVLCDRFIGG